MVGFCHLTDSHHNHHGQKPTMVGICHGGNMLGNHDDDGGDVLTKKKLDHINKISNHEIPLYIML